MAFGTEIQKLGDTSSEKKIKTSGEQGDQPRRSWLNLRPGYILHGFWPEVL